MELTLSTLFTDHAIFQRGRDIPVWGWCRPGDTVTVSFAGCEASATADADGKWLVRLPAQDASCDGRELSVSSGDGGSVSIQDVLVGEVWVCSGQSNMQWAVHQSNDAEAEIAAADHPLIRLYQQPQNQAVTHEVKTLNAHWRVCDSTAVASFSAVGYFFGRELKENLKLPIGLINVSWGGTIAEAWTSREGLLSDPHYAQVVRDYEEHLKDYDAKKAAYDKMLADGEKDYYPQDPGNQGIHDGHAEPDTDTSSWKTLAVPSNWKAQGMNFNGVVWFRHDFDLHADWAGKDLTLSLGAIDKADVTYVNGIEVGETHLSADSWQVKRVYHVPAELTRGGRVTIAVRVFSHVWGAGLIGPSPDMYLQTADGQSDKLPLAGNWAYEVEHDFGLIQPFPGSPAPQGPGNPNSPYILHHSLVEPLLPFAIRGAIWYQGESNAGQAYRYRTLFPLMIQDWRRVWGQDDDFPFLFVQLANFRAIQENPVESDWAELREAQALALQLPNTGMAVITDIGDAADIHPRNKQDVGKRLARWALVKTYEACGMVASGPLFSKAEPEGAVMRIRFRYSDGLCTADGEPLRGFAVAGEDGEFVWADARIDGSTVIVSHPAFLTPKMVRYNWADNPQGNLVNAAGLPAAPFRTDDRPGVTWPKTDGQG